MHHKLVQRAKVKILKKTLKDNLIIVKKSFKNNNKTSLSNWINFGTLNVRGINEN